MKDKRLDQILRDLGYVTEDQIKHALHQQQDQGGRIGSHLLQNGDITEQQLALALSMQHDLPSFQPERHSLSEVLLKKIPLDIIEKHQVLPVSFDPSNGVLTLLVVDPRNQEAVTEIRRIIQCAEVALMVTPESTFTALMDHYVPDDGGRRDPHRRIELPELFHSSGQDLDERKKEAGDGPASDQPLEEILMVSDQSFLKNFLDPIFAREGLKLVAATNQQEVRELLREHRFSRILVSRLLAKDFRAWLRRETLTLPSTQITVFSTVSGALLDNHVPYAKLFQSLIQSLKIVAETHSAPGSFAPPFDLLREDCRDLAEAIELSRLAVDGLQLAALLIVPAYDPATDHSEAKQTEFQVAAGIQGIEWGQTLERARSLRFPWNIEGALRALRELLSERVNLDELVAANREIALAAQVLAIVWHHHYCCGRDQIKTTDSVLAIKTALRKKSGLLALSEIIESYLRLIERSDEKLHAAEYHQLFIIGGKHHVLQQFATRLRHLGYHPVLIPDLDEAKAMCERCLPSAIFVHDASFPVDILKCQSRFKFDTPLLLYAITMENDPSQVLNLFDAGFDDVYSLPHDFDIVAARLRKSIESVPDAVVKPTPSDMFRAAFKGLGFTDLLQALSQALKSVVIHLTRSTGEQATVYLDRGRLVHAVCGQLTGPNAIYAVIAWEENGEFTVEPTEEFPAANISIPLESVLMEGCRILDESKV